MRHPLHPALVHFPVACWSLATAADFAALRWGEPAWRFAGALLVVGTLMAIPALLTGLLELARLGGDGPAIVDVHRHMTAMMAALLLYAGDAFMHIDRGVLAAPGPWAMILGAAGFVCLCIGGWLGGRLVYGHRLGGETIR
jgi:uncharacterized membrane protein